MGRIGLALALLMGWTTLSHAKQAICSTAQFEAPKDVVMLATKLAVALMTTTGLWTFDHPFIAIMVAPFALVWLSELCTTRWVVRQFNGRFYRLEKRDNWIYINNAKLYAPRRAWEKASALPSAAVLD